MPPNTPKLGNGLLQLIVMRNPIRLKWVNVTDKSVVILQGQNLYHMPSKANFSSDKI